MKIREYLEKHGESKTSDISDYLDLSPARTRVILNSMDGVVAVSGNSNRRYRLK